jgi:4-hydroxy-tetrahydrodipicolinate synthase
LPCILYNIPTFTSAIALETSSRLIQEEPGIVGIKDSSGDGRALKQLVEISRERRDETSLLIGQDTLFLDGLSFGWDGCISGLGNLCPEALVQLHKSFRAGDLRKARACQEQISLVSDQVSKLPIPWGIRIGLEVRGLNCGPCSLPVSPERERQVDQFRQWYRDWLANELPVLTRSSGVEADSN